MILEYLTEKERFLLNRIFPFVIFKDLNFLIINETMIKLKNEKERKSIKNVIISDKITK